ncbi:hypothetical protein SS50377_24894 [Spironucleus salmonicida]|uniref:Uncharacterized protein n=1 Tax=Spironucleus salmonicida TaxID=348837 RepID=V6LFZ0_9EUKA|nr:hypothetical protein SS50377_24894 [Spironucleus salmonicida]|eukprot:EST43427.1 Hypothetical protein SS50377_16787 [Spironucleus salmonicida]
MQLSKNDISFSEIDIQSTSKIDDSINQEVSIIRPSISTSAFKLQLEAESRNLDIQLQSIRSKVRGLTCNLNGLGSTLSHTRASSSYIETPFEDRSNISTNSSYIQKVSDKNNKFVSQLSILKSEMTSGDLNNHEKIIVVDELLEKHKQTQKELILLTSSLKNQNQSFDYQLQRIRDNIESDDVRFLLDEVERQRNELHEQRNMLRNQQYTYYRYEALNYNYEEAQREINRLKEALVIERQTK